MKEKLIQIEKYLQDIIEGSSEHIFGSTNAEKTLIAKLLETMEANVHSDELNIPIAPSIFSIFVPVEIAVNIRSDQELLDNLAQNLVIAGKKTGIEFERNITLNVFPDEDLDGADFEVVAMWADESIGSTQKMNLVQASPVMSPPQSFFIVGGTKIFTIEQDLINIGRKLDNHLVIDDPRVSRKHAQIRVVKGRHLLFDLGSSGGTYVNNRRISQVALHPGDVISLAGVPIVYGQNIPANIEDTQEYSPPDHVNNVSTTTLKFTQPTTGSETDGNK